MPDQGVTGYSLNLRFFSYLQLEVVSLIGKQLQFLLINKVLSCLPTFTIYNLAYA